MDSLRNQKIENLLHAFTLLRNKDEAFRFIRDLMTPSEIREFANRLEIARELENGKSYLDIAKKLKVSTTTVTRVAFWLYQGKDGYKLLLPRLKK